MEDWESSSGEVSDAEFDFNDTNDEELSCASGSLPKLQFRSDVSKAKWNEGMGMAEVVEKKGKMWMTTGIVRAGKTFCAIEETLFLAEIGALHIMDDNEMCLSLKDLYGKISEEKSGCFWELFEVYKHLKALGYIVGRHGVPWTLKAVKTCKSGPFQGTPENSEVTDTELGDANSISEMFSNLEVDELRPVFDVYLPNGKFKKSSPGDPTFLLCFFRDSAPSREKVEALERRCGKAPLKFCHVEYGRVSYISFNKVELPVLP